jgi:glucose/arabinose dehydrogenase
MRIVAPLIAAVLLVAACTDSDKPSGRDATSAPATQAPQTAATTSPSLPSAASTPRADTRPPVTARQPVPFDPNAFQLELESVAGGLSQPLFVTHAGDGSGRLFVLEQAGRIRIIANGAVAAQPFLDIRSIVRSGGEQGLLGMAFHPKFKENGRFFIAYTQQNADNTIAEYHISADPNRADPASGRILLAIPDFAPNHNGGMLAFGPDGYLYAGTGDGGGGGDPQRNGQNPQALLGKMLRLNVDAGEPYGIPPDNPFVASGAGRPEVWAIGLRNPWRFSFDRATNDLWIADVGQNLWEEIDLQPAGSRGGENYGWSIMEGAHCFRPTNGCDMTGLVMPVVEYGREGGCSVTGGYVYRGTENPAMVGAYYFGDYCSGRIWALAQAADGSWQRTELLRVGVQISSFGEDEAGELYLTGHNTGQVYRLKAAAQ